MSSKLAPLYLPADVRSLLYRFNLSFDTLLTTNNVKTAKGAETAHTVILHHLPHRSLAAAIMPGHRGSTAPRSFIPSLSALVAREGMIPQACKWNGCPWATNGCAAGCLSWAGHGGLSAEVTAARGRRTLAMIANPETYGRAILWAIARQWAAAQASGVPLAVRLRGTDEGPLVGWHRLAFRVTMAESQTLKRRYGIDVLGGGAHTIAGALSIHAQDGTLYFYDYSKAPITGPLGLIAQRASGWDVTASFAADRPTAIADAIAAHRAGFRLAVPVALSKGQSLPHTLSLMAYGGSALSVPMINGDDSDHRWSEPNGFAVVLRTKLSRGADPALADPFSLRPTSEPQQLADGTVRLIW